MKLTEKIEVFNTDCMEYMAGLDDNAFDLAIVDPPYGINADSMKMGKGTNQKWDNSKKWDDNTPDSKYFQELIRVSEKQIIWGANYFDLPKTGGWIFWDKDRRKDVSFSDGELAWTNFLNTIKKITVRYDGFIGADKIRIHPTQKPVKLYEWILKNYATEGDKILDTHLGSGSSAIACHNYNFEFVGLELDEDYFNDMVKRFRQVSAQKALF